MSEGNATFGYYVEHNTVSVLNYREVETAPNYLSISITSGKSGGKWTVKFVNNNPYKVDIEYNQRLCFAGDASSFSNLNDIIKSTVYANSSTTVTLFTNWFADCVAVKINYYYRGFAYSRVTYAKAQVSPSCSYNQIRYL